MLRPRLIDADRFGLPLRVAVAGWSCGVKLWYGGGGSGAVSGRDSGTTIMT